MNRRSRRGAVIVFSFLSLAWYRLLPIRIVKQYFGDELVIYSGDRAEDPAIRLVESPELGIRTVRNRFVRGLVLQTTPVMPLLRARLLLADLNPRNPTVWTALFARRILKRPTLLWGHAWPRAGKNSPSDRVRGLMRRLASGIVTYTWQQERELTEADPRIVAIAAPNAIYPRARFSFDSTAQRDSVIYVGRIVPEKKPLLLVNAFDKIAPSYRELRLVMVGDGEQLELLTRVAGASPNADRIELLGHISDADRLRELYSRAIVSVSPGYVGLSVTQSLGFGVPMVIARNEPHAPEIEAALEGVNAIFFNSDDPQDLAASLSRVIDERDEWKARGSEISARAAESYSAEAMAEGLINAVRKFLVP